MKDAVESAFAKSKIGVCVKNPSQRILMQNDACLMACGDRAGTICSIGCMERYANDNIAQWKKRGMRLYKNVSREGSYFEIALICTEHHIITLLQPLADRYADAINFYGTMGLSKRELEIMSEVIRGYSNRDICDRLSITKATLKTHLNRVYRKLDDLGEVADYLPAKRYRSKKAPPLWRAD
jgi:DNA-binding CsgD family transcriptional regulator